MTAEGLPRLLVIMGSGETAPTMTSVHAELISRLGPAPVDAVMLDTPFGFQQNADEISERSAAYFHSSVGCDIEVLRYRSREAAPAAEYERMCLRLAQAQYVFAGPGSPTYAVRQWAGTRVPELLTEKLGRGGVVTFASAAAVGLGEVAVPVYEIYKVGEPPRWIEGLDLLAACGLRAAVIPHYNNAEGGTHDTRYCYLGPRRLAMMEEQLPAGCAILGVDEHTAAIIDLSAGTISVRGRGAVVWRVGGLETRWSVGETVSLRELAEGGDVGSRSSDPEGGGDGERRLSGEQILARPAPGSVFMDEVEARRRDAAEALTHRDVDTAVGAILDLESLLHDWAGDTQQSDEPDRGRAMLRELVVGLGELARTGSADPRQRLSPLVEVLLELREAARADHRYADADAIRDALAAASVEVRDTRHGTVWNLIDVNQGNGY